MKITKLSAAMMVVLILLSSLCGAWAFDGSLAPGEYSKEVEVLQRRLDILGYSVGTVDGDYGANTSNAVKSFQTDNGLEATGIVDQATWDALFDEHYIISTDEYELDVKLTPPFNVFESTSYPDMVVMCLYHSSYTKLETCQCGLSYRQETFSVLLEAFKSVFESHYEELTGSPVPPEGLAFDTDYFEINGRKAAAVNLVFSYDDGGITYDFYGNAGILELVEGGTPAFYAYDIGPVPHGETPYVGEETIREVLQNVTPVMEELPAEEPAALSGFAALKGTGAEEPENSTGNSGFSGLTLPAGD